MVSYTYSKKGKGIVPEKFMKVMRCILSSLLVLLLLTGCGGNPPAGSSAPSVSSELTDEQLRDIVLSMPDKVYSHIEERAKAENVTMVDWIRNQANRYGTSVDKYLDTLYKELGIEDKPVNPSTAPTTVPPEDHSKGSWILEVGNYSGTNHYKFYYEEGVLIRYVFTFKKNSHAEPEVTEYTGDALKEAPLGSMTSDEIIEKLRAGSCDYYNWYALS